MKPDSKPSPTVNLPHFHLSKMMRSYSLMYGRAWFSLSDNDVFSEPLLDTDLVS